MFDHLKILISTFINFLLVSGQKPKQDTRKKENNISANFNA